MESEMNIDRAVLAFAGFMILASLLLAWLLSPYWLLLTAFVGLNMLQAAFTGFCPAAMAFSKLGLRQGSAFGLASRLRGLKRSWPGEGLRLGLGNARVLVIDGDFDSACRVPRSSRTCPLVEDVADAP